MATLSRALWIWPSMSPRSLPGQVASNVRSNGETCPAGSTTGYPSSATATSKAAPILTCRLPGRLDLLLAVGLERARPEHLARGDVRGHDPARSGLLIPTV